SGCCWPASSAPRAESPRRDGPRRPSWPGVRGPGRASRTAPSPRPETEHLAATLPGTMQAVPGSDRELTDGWRAAAADDHLRRAYTEHDFDDATWHPITVPGHWRSS